MGKGERRILAVDDEPDITLTVKTGLEDTGLFVVETFTLNLHYHLLNLTI
jgi:hypothetical protein